MIEDKAAFYTSVILILLIVVFISVLSYGIYVYDKDKFECINNPLHYFEDSKNVTCQCTLNTGFEIIIDPRGISD